MLDEKWMYWEGPNRHAPVEMGDRQIGRQGTVVNSNDRLPRRNTVRRYRHQKFKLPSSSGIPDPQAGATAVSICKTVMKSRSLTGTAQWLGM
jgi:hypothetical protein